MLHGILSALGGSEDVTYQRDEQGNLVATRGKIGPGMQAKRIIAGALTGAAAGYSVQPGPGAVGRAAGASFQAGANIPKAQDAARRQQADTDFDAKQKATLQKAQVAKLTQDVSTSAFDLSRKQVGGAFEDSERESSFVKSIAAGGQGSVDLGVAKNLDEVIDMHRDMPSLLEQQSHGNVIGIPHVNGKGQVDGMHYALVTPEWKSAKLDKDEVFYRLTPGEKGGKPSVEKETVKAGTQSNGEFWTNRMAGEKQILDWYKNQSTIEGENSRAAGAQAGENARAAAHEAGEDRRATANNATKETVAGTKVNRQDVREHDKAYVQPAETTEKSYQMMQHAYDEYQTAKKAGKELPTGAQSMLALSTHLATTFGNVKGARVTKDMIHEHLGARGISDSAQVAVQRLFNGDQLSSGQWDAFHDLIRESRRISWETAVKQAKRKNVPVDFLPDDLKDLAGQGGSGGSGGGQQTQPQGGGGFFEAHGGKALQ